MMDPERDYYAEEFTGSEVSTEPKFPIEEYLDPAEQRRVKRARIRTFHQGGNYVGEMRITRRDPNWSQQVESPRTTALIPTLVRRIRKMWRRN